MPVGEPSLSMQGSLPPLFLSVVLTLSLTLCSALYFLSVLHEHETSFLHVLSEQFQTLHETCVTFKPVMCKLNKLQSLSDVQFSIYRLPVKLGLL